MSAYYSGSSHLKKGDDDKNVNDNADADAEPDDEEKVTLLSKNVMIDSSELRGLWL